LDLHSPRWKKVLRDIWGNKSRTGLVVAAITVGVFAFGGMFITRDVLIANMNMGFMQTNPATITFTIRQPFDDGLVRTSRTFPYVQEVTARSEAQIHVWNGSKWERLTLIAAPDVLHMPINRLELEQGRAELGRREILFERQSILNLPGAHVGSTVRIELPDGTHYNLKIVGVVHDFNAVPASRIPILTGYVKLDTMNVIGLNNSYDEIQIVTEPYLQTEDQLEAAANRLSDLFGKYGYTVNSTSINEPGKHWASDFIDAVALVLIILGSLALGLSGLLVVNMIMAILAQQKRQIGMMKAVGGTARDVMGIYLTMSGIYGVAGLMLAVPLSMAMAQGMIHALAGFLNVNILSFAPPAWIFGLEFLVAVFVPLLAAFVPVVAGTRMTVREAVSDYGIGGIVKPGFFDSLILGIKGWSRPVLLSLRNTFRQKGRLTLTLATLAMAGAIFIAVLNTRASVLKQFDQVLAMFGYDVQIVLTGPEQVARLQREASRIEGVNHVEGWGFSRVTIIRPPGVAAAMEESLGPRGRGGPGSEQVQGSNNKDEGPLLTVFAPPPDTQFIHPTILEGRWMQPGDRNVMVIASEVANAEPWIKVGETYPMDFGVARRNFTVIGIVNLVGPEFGYAPFDEITRIQGAQGLSFVAMLGTTSREVDFQELVARKVKDHFQDIGIGVEDAFTPSSFIGVITSQVDFFVAFMLFMAILLGVVGGLGLSTTMSLNVLERTREIGVMRAIGAGDGDVRSIVLTEGVIIGLISYVIGAVISFPVTVAFLVGVGNAFFQRPLDFKLAPFGFVAWLAIVIVLAMLASLLPANKAASTTVREALAYE